jgi:hypothetical protein
MRAGLHDDLLPTILEVSVDCFAGTSPVARHELDTLLHSRDITGGPGWLIDTLALTRMRLPNAAGQRQTAKESAVKTHGF